MKELRREFDLERELERKKSWCRHSSMLSLWSGSTTSMSEINSFAVSLTPIHSLLAKLYLASMMWRIMVRLLRCQKGGKPASKV